MRRNKYNNQRTEYDGYKFDSLAERDRYIELRQLQSDNWISGLRVHPRYEIIPSYKKCARRVRAAYYIADFEYRHEGELVIEDVKGVETAVFKLKRKLFESKYPHEITIVKR